VLLGSGGGRVVVFFAFELVLRAARGASAEAVRVRGLLGRFVSAAFQSAGAVHGCCLGWPSVDAVRSCFWDGLLGGEALGGGSLGGESLGGGSLVGGMLGC
jgi:hypothetical protein